MTKPERSSRSWISILHAAPLVALWVAAFVFYRGVGGSSPIAWLDTFNDQALVEHCLEQGACTRLGVQTSVRGIFHGVSWLDLLTLAAWSGATLDQVLLILQILNACLLVMVFVVGTRLGGPLAGALAAAIMTFGIGQVGVPPGTLRTLSLAPLVGGVLAMACSAVIDRPGIVAVALASLVAAVLANVHAIGVLSGISVVWVALLAPRRRVWLALFGAVLFATTTVAIAPSVWRGNLLYVLTASPAPHVGSEVARSIDPILVWAMVAGLGWAASWMSRGAQWAAYRRRSQGVLAVMAPILVAYVAASQRDGFADPKYLSQIKAAVAIGAGLPLATLAMGASRHLLPSVAQRALAGVLPVLLAGAILLTKPNPYDPRTPTVADLDAAARVLHDERRWSAQEVAQRLQAPDGLSVLDGVLQRYPTTRQASDGMAQDEAALLMTLDASDVVEPMPANWHLLRRTPHTVTVLIVHRSPLDWRAFSVCARREGEAAETCAEAQWQTGSDRTPSASLVGLPAAGIEWRGTLRLRVPLRLGSSATRVLMPHIAGVCGGRIKSVTGARAAIGDYRRVATIEPLATAGTDRPSIELEWTIGAPECAVWSYHGIPPFILVGDVDQLATVERALRKRERTS